MALRRRYLAWWAVGTDDRAGLSVFEFSPKRWWTGVTAFVPAGGPDADWRDYVERQRAGRRVWPR